MNRAMLIASSEFSQESGIEPLRFPINDVDGMEKILRSDEFAFEVQKLTNVTSSILLQELDKWVSKVDYNDLVLIYFSGHGKLSRKRDLFLSCANTTSQNLISTALKYTQLTDLIHERSLQKVAIILDCCYAGRALVGTRGDTRGAVEEQVRVAVEASGSGIFFLGASGKNQTAEEREIDGHGRFTKQIIEGLGSGDADIDNDGNISAKDLATYVKQRLRSQSASQEPIEGGAYQGELILGSNRRKKLKATLLAIHTRIEVDKSHFTKETFRKIEDYIDDVNRNIDNPELITTDQRYLLLKNYAANMGTVEQVIREFWTPKPSPEGRILEDHPASASQDRGAPTSKRYLAAAIAMWVIALLWAAFVFVYNQYQKVSIPIAAASETDPFKLVASTLARSPQLKPENCSNNKEIEGHCKSPLNQSEVPVTVLVASVSGAANASEDRQRMRYAVLAGLEAEGYALVEPGKIGFYWPGAVTSAAAGVQLPTVVPFEWFKPSSVIPNRVLLLWFDEDVLRFPAKQFKEFMCKSLTSESTSSVYKAVILGPQSSDTLRAMVLEDHVGWDWCRQVVNPPFYIYNSSAGDLSLIPNYVATGPPCRASDSCLTEYFAKKGIRVYRLAATDEALARTVRDELRLRRVYNGFDRRPYHHVALVSESDRLYGRALSMSIARCLEAEDCQLSDRNPFADNPWFQYSRGFDGQLSGNYLRRLIDGMQDRDKQLRRQNPQGIEAVGIIGFNASDTLLLLEALRPSLPNALFFTTDLDVRLKSVRNLLIASSFGLGLRPAIQGDTLPFASSSDTAGFLAARLALQDGDVSQAARLMPRPLLFEVGISGLFQFPNLEEAETEDQRPDYRACRTDLLKCQVIHPLPSPMFPRVSAASAVGLSSLGLLSIVGLPVVRRRIWRQFHRIMRSSQGHAILITWGLFILSGIGVSVWLLSEGVTVVWAAIANTLTKQGGQPIILLDGISVWPTVFLRCLILGFCVWLIVRAVTLLYQNEEKIAHDLSLVEMRMKARAGLGVSLRAVGPWVRFISQFWFCLPVDLPKDICRYWGMYIYQGNLAARLCRALVMAVAITLLWLLLESLFESPPVPARGDVSWFSYVTVRNLLGISTFVLIALVADATILTWRLVKALRVETSIWPATTLKKVSHRLSLPQSMLDDWIDLIFVSKYTKLINALLYYPFVIVTLLVVSRSRLFANYAINIPDLVTVAVGLVFLSICVVTLRWTAEMSRAAARRRLRDQITTAIDLKDGGRRAGQLKMLLQRVEELRGGAFSPFIQQSLPRAMLLLLGSLAVLELVEYLFQVSFL